LLAAAVAAAFLTHNSSPFIKTEESNTNTWSKMGCKYFKIKMGYVCDLFIPRFQSQEQFSWAFHADDSSESSSTYDMIIDIPKKN
jgi:hypothetical protein